MKRKWIIAILIFVGITTLTAWHYQFETKLIGTALIAKLPAGLNQKTLIRMLDLSDNDFPMWAAHHLGKIGDSEAYKPLVMAINHPIPMVRHNAINAMIELEKQDLAAQATIKNIENINEEAFVIDSALSLLSNLQKIENMQKTIVALREYAPRAKYPWKTKQADEIIKKYEAFNQALHQTGRGAAALTR